MASVVSEHPPLVTTRKPLTDDPPVVAFPAIGREILAVILLVILADVTIYRGGGYAGWAAFLVGAPVLLRIGSLRRVTTPGLWLVSAMLLLLSARMIWLGSLLGLGVAAVLVVAYSLLLRGQRPYVLDVIGRIAQLTMAGGFGLALYARVLRGRGPRMPSVGWLNVLLPALALALFGTCFLLANPDLVEQFSVGFSRFIRWLSDRVEAIAESWPEFFFWIATSYVAIGLLRPLIDRPLMPDSSDALREVGMPTFRQTPIYSALRNTLLAVIGLFAVYLVFEFKTLWFRRFPPGFYYAGYAHEGAAWLTVALALATLALSLMFRGPLLDDPRLPSLKTLAWIWSAENLLLALTVYNRMYIYIDFNGMTRMRTIGLFGISTVVVGFALVLWKIIGHRDFLWLIHRQLWALAFAIYLFALTPVDALVHQYNVRRILAGDLAPAVQISVHRINSEGLLVLSPLINCHDPIIRDGVRAMLADRESELEQRLKEQKAFGWTGYQLADRLLIAQMRRQQGAWADLADESQRRTVLEQFHRYAYQWY
jgi:hypothetical protein